MRRRLSLVALTMLTTVLILALGAGPALAVLEDDWPAGSLWSETNPGALDERETSWRWNWGNTLYPNLQIQATNVPTDPDIVTTGFLYAFDQDPTTLPSLFSQPVEFSSESSGTLLEQNFNVPGIMDGRGYTPQLGTNVPGEGQWWVHIRLVNPIRAEIATGTLSVPIGVDLTDPDPVQNLRATVDGTNAVTGWTAHTRRILRWDNIDYDELSGAGAFEVAVNGVVKTKALCPMPDPNRYWWSAERGYTSPTPTDAYPDPDALTLEQLPPGRAKIEVTVIDRATNRSTPVTVYAYSDPDTPTVSISAPASAGQQVGKSYTFKATAKDLGGVKSVKFYVDGVLKSTDTASPYEYKSDLSVYANASTHTLGVTVEDELGRTVSTSRTFKVDKVGPKFSSLTAGPNPFYPRKRDGYKDNMTAKFKLSERANVDMLVYNSSGKLWRTVKVGTKNAGWVSAVWNGKGDNGKVASGNFRFKLRATDTAGNTTTTGWYSSSIRFYQVVRVSDSAVKIIQR